ncbi:replication protein P [Pantoea sp. GL120224-02]|uniref:replication protein P n=1 Tax=Pantoea sp. GL120224-02 TaxID=1378084 RepID=UPI0034E97DD7
MSNLIRSFDCLVLNGESRHAGLPDEHMLYVLVLLYSVRRGLDNSPEAYPWKANAHYWLVTTFHSQMCAKCSGSQSCV